MSRASLTAAVRPSSSAWLAAGASLIALGVALPVLTVAASVFSGEVEVWNHLRRTVLADYVTNSFILMLGVGLGVLLLGVPAAWFTGVCEFPGRAVFEWALLLPLAFPAYIIAYTYTGVLDYAGPVQGMIRRLTGLGVGEYWFFPVRSMAGAILMLALVLYPYVYLMARAAFLEQSTSVLEVSRTFGYGVRAAFFRLAIPLARPAIVTGLSLALMETLADYGVVQYFGLGTFTTGIFKAFHGFGDAAAAAQLSAALLAFVALLLFMERQSRRRARYHATGPRAAHRRRVRLRGARAAWAWIGCLVPVLFGFIVPALVLAKWTLFDADLSGSSFPILVWHSFSLAFATAVVAVVLALLLGYARRVSDAPAVRLSVGVSGLGYAVPGAVIAVGVIIPLAWLDHRIIDLARALLDLDLGLTFSGTLFALLFAYTARFLAVSLGAVQSGLDKIGPSLDDAARSLGHRALTVVGRVHVPLMRASVLTAVLIVFVDVLKELPATLILRPFNFNTLAVRAYELASDERLIDAAPASLMIVLVGLAPVILLSRSMAGDRPACD